MVYRDLKNVIDTAREEGREEGRELERTLIREQLLARGIDPSLIEGILGPKAGD